MTKLLFRNVRSGKRKSEITNLHSIVRKEIEDTMKNKVKPAVIQSHKNVVKDWKHKVDFDARTEIKPKEISLVAFPTGANLDIYTFVDQGTKPHTITNIKPVRAKSLKFQAGGTYVSKTLAKPARTVSGGGRVVGGVTTFAKSVAVVNHPGNEARNFSKTIGRDIQPSFRREIENAFRRSIRKIEE